MAIDPSSEFAGKIDNTDPTGYPLGKARNVTTPGDGTGTPWLAPLVNDLFGLQQALLTVTDGGTGITPSGTPDAADASQYLEALQKLSGREVFTADGTFNPPAWVKRIKVTVVSAGGGGGFGSGGRGGTGGGGGNTLVAVIDDPVASYEVVIGAGGAGSGSGDGADGGASSFSVTAGATLVEGQGGEGGRTSGATDTPLGGSTSTGTLTPLANIHGGHGGQQFSAEVNDKGGDGGFSTYGSGGAGSNAFTSAGIDATAYGAGGGGGQTDGGDGADGIVVIEWGLGI